MPMIKMQITEKKDSITFDGIDKYFIPILYLKYTYYKLAYIFNISYFEAMSMFKSNSKSKIMKVVEQTLSINEREGN